MKAKVKIQKTDDGVIIGQNAWDGTVTINGKSYQPGKEYEITKELFKSGQFVEIKAKKGKNNE